MFNKAKEAKQKWNEAQLEEDDILQQYLNALNGNLPSTGNTGLPANTPTTPAGTEVALEDGWGLQTVKYTRTSNGSEVTELETVATVYAIAVGNGETVPVPKEFYYVGGTLASGVVISDDPDDKNKYAGKTTVGIDLEGNQFVWIPCTATNYKKTSWGQGEVTNRSSSYWDMTESKAEKAQIEKYGGYYVQGMKQD